MGNRAVSMISPRTRCARCVGLCVVAVRLCACVGLVCVSKKRGWCVSYIQLYVQIRDLKKILTTTTYSPAGHTGAIQRGGVTFKVVGVQSPSKN
jgi:hypothetical protein